MAEECLRQLPTDQNIDFHIITLLERLETIRKDSNEPKISNSLQLHKNMHAEIRSLEFWRSIISECLASFFYVFIVCGAAAGAGVGASVSSVLLATALSSGFAISALTQCFMHISGAHINPAVSLAKVIIRSITPLRGAMYITAQCGGGIAGAALLYGITVPGYQGNLQAAVSHSSTLAAWERFGVEFILTFIVVLVYFVSTNSYKKYLSSSSLAIGAAYSACSFVSMPYLNPARSLGPSFVLNKWDNHWVYWLGPLFGGAVSGIIYEFVFNPKRNAKRNKDAIDNESSSMNSDEDINYDMDLEKPNLQTKALSANFNSYRSPTGILMQQQNQQQQQQSGYLQSVYATSTPTSKIDRVESIYGGTRSLYCKSPPLTRANLNRSQSVYAKSQTAINRDLSLPRAGPLVPAQSLYPLRVTQTQNSHVQNQNVQNQMQQRSESIYGIRGSIRQQPERLQPEPIGFQPIYGTRNNPILSGESNQIDRDAREPRDDTVKYTRTQNRPESMYGVTARRGQSIQSDDSSYGSYHGPAATSMTPTTRAINSNVNSNYNIQGGGIIMSNYNTQPQQQQSIHIMHQQQQQQQQQAQNERKSSVNSGHSGQQQQQTQRSNDFNHKQMQNSGGHTITIQSPQQQQQQPPMQQLQYNVHPNRPN